MKCLFVISSSQIGGAEKQFIRTVVELKQDLDITICILGNQGPMRPQYLTSCQNVYESSGTILSDISTLLRAIRHTKPDAIISWLYRADILCGVLGKFLGVERRVGSARNTEWPNSNYFKTRLIRWSSNFNSTKIIANSNKAKSFHLRLGCRADKIEVIRNFIPNLEKIPATPSHLTLGIAARPTLGKGHFLAIKIAEELRNRNFNVQLKFIGPNILSWTLLMDEIKDKLDFIKVENGDADISNWFRSLDLYLGLSEKWESDSNSVIEAIMYGIPVLVSKVQEIEDLDGHLQIAENLSIEALSDKVELMLFSSVDDKNEYIDAIRSLLINKRNANIIKKEWLDAIYIS